VTDFEKLGAFYLGKRVGTDDGALRHDELVLYNANHLVTHALLRGHDRQRQDGSVHVLARRGGDRRHPRDRDRPEG
jgi:hypothetical protein